MTVLEHELQAEQVLADALSDYAGRWVAVKGQQVVLSADTVEDILAEAKASCTCQPHRFPRCSGGHTTTAIGI